MKKSIYEIVTEKVIEQLEKGVVPWRKPWINGGAVNWKTQRPYRGINTFLLESGEYATFKQIQDAGGKVKKGEKSHIVVFWKWIEKENEESREIEKIPYLRSYRVFEINNQVEGLESKKKDTTFDHDPIEKAEEIFKGFIDSPEYTFYSGRAVYYPTVDKINCPPLKDFQKAEEFYSTLFHEMIHSTGHRRRLARLGVTTQNVAFGDEVYSKEELVAEMGAAMLCGIAGIDNNTLENSASYIQSWLRSLKEDSRLVVQAAAQAQKAADYILGIEEIEEG
ncbi:ArdC family protein [Bacillus salipaludis]|uniref:Zincin-like metallopeptidase domain-containing protein n=1 Tax=Bacillus salipaludis TaxID=2547811 RepID=A0AA90TWW5_9BACI|nr:zincin-like metallopeptidase domain-containing protein [Bacillus salipaludis]MDQ6601010.1 zincin-like metallopeptidase domain-containing protein [Bacillus salipaludis]